MSYLLKEVDAVDHSKSAIAIECGIPIITPSEFVSILQSRFAYIPEEQFIGSGGESLDENI